MTLDGILNKVNFFAGKDVRGNTLSPGQLNTILPAANYSFAADELKKLTAQNTVGIPSDRLSTTPLRVLKDSLSRTVDDGTFQLPDDYLYYLNCYSNLSEIDIVTEPEFNKRRFTVCFRPTVRPIGYLTESDLMVAPSDIGAVQMNYLHKPADPYYDYCQETATLNPVFMPEGSRIVASDVVGVYNLVDANGAVLKAGVTHTNGNYPYNSVTVELEWEELYHDQIVLRLLAMVGLNISEVELAKYAEQKQAV